MKKITMKNPCPKKWENMQGNNNVRLCESCDRNVENFTDKSVEEIIEILESRKERTCARIFSSQLNPVKKIAAAILIGGMLVGGSCSPKMNQNLSTITMENETIIPSEDGKIIIGGSVLSNKKEELLGVTVLIIHKENESRKDGIGTVTNIDGTFSFEGEISEGIISDYILEVTYLGFEPFSISLEKVNMKKDLKITLAQFDENDPRIIIGELLLEEKRNFG